VKKVDIKELTEELSTYSKEVSEGILKTDFNVLADIAYRLINAKINGKTIFTAGNGGSAATASHMVNDLIKGCRVFGREGFRAFCLNDSTPVMTCLANDFSYKDIYSVQLKTLAKSGDIFIVFSGSGNSPNIVDGVKTAKEMGLHTIGFSGRDGGKLKGLCDTLLIAPTYSMEQLEDMHMLYEHALACTIRNKLKNLWGIEILKFPPRNFPFSSALFDFDGTVSLIREGWQEVMIPYFVEVLSAAPNAEGEEEIKKIVTDFVDTLTGKQTIFQCMRLDEEVVKRCGLRRDPLEYKREYLRRLQNRIKDRYAALENKTADPSEYIVPGCIELFRQLQANGVKLYLASGTDEQDVLREAKLLGVDSYFDGGIYGAKDEIMDCSKELVIRKILEDNRITGDRLLSFGDGYVEIELVVQVGGYAVAAATDEVRRFGINEWKRNRLISAGAAAVIPDFSHTKDIIDFLKGGN
jgi:phosphoheptose isomerase/phosphoglycolate phosphatase-like HAD superfamily hydrolase